MSRSSEETFIGLGSGTTVDPDPAITVRPPDVGTVKPEILGALPRFDGGTLSFEGTLGEGGMGLVHLARQREFGRTVAVKTLKPAFRNDAARQKMLQEAWAAGCLEHPHIVPVYALGLDPDDMPCIVLKHIEGVRWADLLAEGDDRLGDDPQAFHLDVLEDVCRAIAYAHDRGVVHRDLKPSNVMIGSFDEVTLLDWGLAVAVEGGDERLPKASEERRLAGTPHYMAPEQLAEGDVRCSPGTDVYLLAALLYQVLHGHPPHQGPDVWAILDVVRTEEPALSEVLDDEVRALLADSFQRDPSARPSARSFLDRLRAWRTHQGARVLAAEADTQLEALAAELGKEEPDPQRVMQHFGAARFGYEQARRVWAEAPVGIGRAADWMARWYLGQGQLQAARWLLHDLGVRDAALEQAIADQERLQREEAHRQALLVRQYDMRAGIRTRAFVLIVVGTSWAATPALAAWFEAAYRPLTHVEMFLQAVVLLLLVLGLMTWARDSLSLSELNRATQRGMPFATVVLMVALGVGWVQGLDPHRSMALAHVGFTGMATVVTATMGWRYLPMTLVYMGSAVVSARRPDLVWWTMAVANTSFALNAILPMSREALRALREDD